MEHGDRRRARTDRRSAGGHGRRKVPRRQGDRAPAGPPVRGRPLQQDGQGGPLEEGHGTPPRVVVVQGRPGHQQQGLDLTEQFLA